jgi:hypothetical protein
MESVAICHKKRTVPSATEDVSCHVTQFTTTELGCKTFCYSGFSSGNNPIKYTDPDGRCPVVAVVGAVAKKMVQEGAKNAAMAFAASYLSTTFVRMLNGESIEQAIIPTKAEIKEHGIEAAKGFGSGAIGVLFGKSKILKEFASYNMLGNAVSTVFATTVSAVIPKIAENIANGDDITKDLDKVIKSAVITGLISSLTANTGITTGNASGAMGARINTGTRFAESTAESVFRETAIGILYSTADKIKENNE